jgi:hypothetical protein
MNVRMLNACVARRYGTGSYPLSPNGLHRKTRQMASRPPARIPYRAMASYPYSEQVGTNRHAGGKMGEIALRYSAINTRASHAAGLAALRGQSDDSPSHSWWVGALWASWANGDIVFNPRCAKRFAYEEGRRAGQDESRYLVRHATRAAPRWCPE